MTESCQTLGKEQLIWLHFVGFVSMETALTFDPKCFIKITDFLTSLPVSYMFHIFL